MTPTKPVFSAMCLDTLKEVANIGAGNAMTALSNMLDHAVDMSVPHVGLVALGDFVCMAGGSESRSVGVYMYVDGEAPGHVAFLWPHADACNLVDAMMMQAPGTTITLGEMECSALKELGNIMASSYLVAIGDLTGLNLLSSPPEIASDMTGALLSCITTALIEDEDIVLTIITHLSQEEGTVKGYFTYIPESGSLSTILKSLNMDG